MANWATVSTVAEFQEAAEAAAPAPAAAPPAGRRSHEIDYEILGDDMQVVEVELDPGEVVIAEAGVMNYMDDGIRFEARFGDGSKPEAGFRGKVLDAGKRKLTGESLFLTHFTNAGSGKKRVAFAAPYPGRIVALDLGRLGGEIVCQKDAFLCAAMGTEIDIAFAKRFGAGLFGGEGLFLATLQGTGTVWLQTLPFSRLAGRIAAGTAASKGEGSILGRIATSFES